MADEDILYKALRRKVETFTGVTPETRRHFDMLAQILFERTRAMVSATTLRRFWGYQETGSGGVSRNTLDVLSRLIGYDGWSTFSEQDDSGGSSDLMVDHHELAIDGLRVGKQIELAWAPERRVIIEFLGGYAFRVLSSENSKLMVGDTFQCRQIVEGKPMICSNLLRPGYPAMSYLCGKMGGVKFTVGKFL